LEVGRLAVGNGGVDPDLPAGEHLVAGDREGARGIQKADRDRQDEQDSESSGSAVMSHLRAIQLSEGAYSVCRYMRA
jgi:hypothetical protein